MQGVFQPVVIREGFPLNQDRHVRPALAGNNGVNFPMADLRPQIDVGWTLGYVYTVRYPRNPDFLARKPFMPLFMISGQVCCEIRRSVYIQQIDSKFVVRPEKSRGSLPAMPSGAQPS
jgi:hypothetical protein